LDHCHKKLDIPADYTEFIQHVDKMMNIPSDDDEIGQVDETLGIPDDPKSISHERRKTDNDVTLHEKIRKLIFNLYTLSYINYLD